MQNVKIYPGTQSFYDKQSPHKGSLAQLVLEREKRKKERQKQQAQETTQNNSIIRNLSWQEQARAKRVSLATQSYCNFATTFSADELEILKQQAAKANFSNKKEEKIQECPF